MVRKSIEKIWGWRRGKDYEVIANVLYGLYLYDYQNFKDGIEKGVSYLERMQSQEGYWDSTWYWGKFYGTYVAVRIIKAVKPGSPSLKRAEEFLINSQNYDGGWGDIGSDPLNTALALLSLSFLGSSSYETYIRGIKYLCLTQNKKGYWDKVEFIKMDVGKTTYTYKSKVITTQFCLKVLLALINLPFLNLKGKKGALQKVDYKKPNPQIYLVCKDYFNFLHLSKDEMKEERHKLLDTFYISPNNLIFKELVRISSLSYEEVIEVLCDVDKFEIFIKQLDEKRLIKICKRSVSRCFKTLPLDKIPSIYVCIGPYNFKGTWAILNDRLAIIISLGLPTETCCGLDGREYFYDKYNDLRSRIELMIGTQYCHLIFYKSGLVRETLLDRLCEEGFISHFLKNVFPEYLLSYCISLTLAEIEWCLKNESFLRENIKQYLYSRDVNTISRFFSRHDSEEGATFPPFGYFIGYRIIEEYFKRDHSVSFRNLIRESLGKIVSTSMYFSYRFH